jgi:hypothetical protein
MASDNKREIDRINRGLGEISFQDKHNPIEILRAKTLGLMVSLEIARKHNSRIHYASTSEFFGDTKVVPTPDSCHGNVKPVGPGGCYDEAKRPGEAYVVACRRQHGLEVMPHMREADGTANVCHKSVSSLDEHVHKKACAVPRLHSMQ